MFKKIAAILRTPRILGVNLFINARTDVYLRGIASGGTAIEGSFTGPRATAQPL